MVLPTLPKKEPRPTAVTVRLSKQAVISLKMLADEHNMSQADVIEFLITSAANDFKAKPNASSKKKKDPA